MGCTISYIRLILSQCQLALFWSHNLSHPGARVVGDAIRVTEMLTGSGRCEQAAGEERVRLDVAVCLTRHLWHLQRFEGWGRTGARSQQFPGQPLSRVNYYTNQMLLPVMVIAPVNRGSFAHLFYAYLSFIMWCLWDTRVCRSLRVCSSGATVWGV